jgi:hypothetical protein
MAMHKNTRKTRDLFRALFGLHRAMGLPLLFVHACISRDEVRVSAVGTNYSLHLIYLEKTKHLIIRNGESRRHGSHLQIGTVDVYGGIVQIIC